ncbi:MAG: ATP-binding protein [Bacteroidales bacterium]|jgi:serine/threonine-protein kinase RsbW|nr:ATP-binding protein [Bacteroidales bacterium]
MEKSILIESKIENISKIEKIIDEVSEEAKINSEVYGKILIATVEAVNNSIVHGNSQDESKNVKVDFLIEQSYISIFIEDEGPGFNFYNVPDPTTPDNIENIHGRGVYLMKHLADDVIFHGNGNRVEIRFNLK